MINERAVQWLVKKFPSGNYCLEDEEYNSRPREVDNDRLKELVETEPCTIFRQPAFELRVTIHDTFRTLANKSGSQKTRQIGTSRLQRKQVNRLLDLPSAHLIRNQNEPFQYAPSLYIHISLTQRDCDYIISNLKKVRHRPRDETRLTSPI
ncbi:hypothetical protein AVEN_139517-1 [Araneus ventricosus]|uniref:Uncharacterized protein n=1 Tax=Araneus ventricosus TaxID=182803 RepID=A0A4Y2KS21_ARAVE|nr:hypothetical protein AVEN_139517-1 [Araneus ventricosus]